MPFGDRAADFLVIARNGSEVDAFIVPRHVDGLSISEPELNMGMKGLTTVTLDLERVEVPAENRLGGEAGCNVRRLLDGSRVALAGTMLGLSRAVLDYCIPYYEGSGRVRRSNLEKSEHCLSHGRDAHRNRGHAVAHVEGREPTRAGTRCDAIGKLRTELCGREVDVDRAAQRALALVFCGSIRNTSEQHCGDLAQSGWVPKGKGKPQLCPEARPTRKKLISPS